MALLSPKRDRTKELQSGQFTQSFPNTSNAFTTGTGSITPTTGTGSDNPALPAGTQVPFTDPKTGRRTGAGAVGGRSFFVTGSDLALLQSQLSGSQGVEGNAMQNLDAQQQAFKQAQEDTVLRQQQREGAATIGQGAQITSSGLTGVQFLVQDLKNARMLKGAMQGDVNAARALGLDDFDVAVLQSGQADINAFSQFMETNSLFRKLRVKGFGIADLGGKAPRAQIDTSLGLMKKATERAQEYANLAITNPALREFYISKIREIEQEILKYESVIQIVSIQSPDVQANPEVADEITLDIQGAKNSLIDSRLKAGI